MVADHWFMQIEKVLETMEITSDTTRIRLAAFQLKGEAQVWWRWTRTSRDLEAMTWVEFQKLFMGKYFPETARHAKAQEFLELKQGVMTVMDYVARFIELTRFAGDYVATDMAKVRRLENGLKLSIRARIAGLRLQDMDSMVGTALTIEREMEDARSTRDASASGKRKDSQSSSSSGKRQGATWAPHISQASPRGQSMGRGRGRGPQAGTSGVQGHVYAVTPQAKSADQPVIQGMFFLSRLWSRVLFDSDASHSFIAASVVIELGLEVETLEEPLYVSSPLWIRVRIGMICRGCELEISGTLLTVDLRIMDMSEFDVILGMDWLTTYRVVIDCERRRATAYTQDGTRVVFQGDKHDILPHIVYESRCQGQLAGWLASLTLEDEVRPDLDLPRVVCEYADVFPDELP